jgi:hypothetical protein
LKAAQSSSAQNGHSPAPSITPAVHMQTPSSAQSSAPAVHMQTPSRVQNGRRLVISGVSEATYLKLKELAKSARYRSLSEWLRNHFDDM